MNELPSPPAPEFELDLVRYELRVGGTPTHLERQPMQLLTLLVRAKGGLVTREAIEKELWGEGVYVDAERGINNAVRKIRAALRDSVDEPRVLETVVGMGYRLIAPIRLIEAPEPAQAGDKHADGAAREAGAEASPTGPALSASATRRPLGMVAALIAFLLVAAVVLAFDAGNIRSRLFGPSRGTIRSLAVLPLRNLSESPAQDFFAAGLTDELTATVARLGTMRVVSATTALQYGGSQRPLPQVARELNVEAVLEGSVVSSGNKVRVTVQLIDARTDVHLWAQTYERDRGEILEIQDSIAQDIARQLNARLGPGQKQTVGGHERIDPAAYEAYLRGRNELGKQRGDALLKGAQFFQQAIDAEPLYAPAYAGLADSYSLLANYAVLPPREAFPRAAAAAAKALELDPASPEAHTALAFVKHHYDWDWSGAETEYRRALELNPSSSIAHLRYSEYLSNIARHDDALREIRLAHDLAPLSLVISSNVARVLYHARRYDEAIVELQRVLALDPDRAFTRIFLATSLEEKGSCAEALEEFRKFGALIRNPNTSGMAHADASCGKLAEARRILADLEQPSDNGMADWMWIAGVHARLGEKDMAFQWLEKAYQNRDFFLTFVKVHPYMDPLRPDARFDAFLNRMNFPK